MEEAIEKSGDAMNPATWVEEHGDYLFRYALSRLRDAESAEEVVQEMFLAGLRHAGQFAGRGTDRAWLLGILKRKIVDYIRKRSRASNLSTSGDENDPSDMLFDQTGSWRAEFRRGSDRPLDSLERKEFWDVLRKCLDGLTPRQADVFTLREMEQLTTEEICKELEISTSNLWVLLHRARLRLSVCMKSRWQNEVE